MAYFYDFNKSIKYSKDRVFIIINNWKFDALKYDDLTNNSILKIAHQ
jgi:hypothetical protein